MKHLALITLTLLAGFSAFAQEESAPAISGIEQRIGRALSQDENSDLASLFTRVSQLEREDRSRFMANDVQFTYLGCVGGKVAAVIKRGYAVCADTSGHTYVLRTTGTGASIGIKATGDIVVHAGRKNQIKGVYGNGAPVETLDQYEEYFRFGRMLAQFASLDVDFFTKNDESQARLFFVGVNYGRYFDLSKDTLEIQ